MKNALVILLLSLGLAALDADAAKRFGGGGNIGKQRPTPTAKEATANPAAPTTPPQSAAAPAATPTPVTPAPQPSFMSKWGGMIAGLGIGALLGSMFGGGSFGGAMAGILMVLAVVAAGFMLFRFLAARGSAAPSPRPMQFAGIGGDAAPRQPVVIGSAIASSAQAPAGPAASLPPGFETEPFLRVAKTSFIRLQAANDAGDLDDIRDYTTPEMFAELSMQVGERGGAQQKTEVVSVDAKLVEAVVEGDYEIASVRFSGLIREAPEANPEPFDEIWHVRKKANDRKATWLIAGIQQAA